MKSSPPLHPTKYSKIIAKGHPCTGMELSLLALWLKVVGKVHERTDPHEILFKTCAYDLDQSFASGVFFRVIIIMYK